MFENQYSTAAKREISRVLWEIWDPIGVNKLPEARSEYDTYVYGVFVLLVSGEPDFQLASHLLNIVHEKMGLTSAKFDDMLPTVRALRSIKLA